MTKANAAQAGGVAPPAGVEPALVEIRDVVKTFGATEALKGVSFDIRPGETLGLLGANGAGKSTLIKILSGNHPPTSGDVVVDGARRDITSPMAARDCGIATVHQNIDDGVVFGMSVADNLLLDDIADPATPFFLDQGSVLRRARAVERRLGLALPLTAPVEDLSASGRQEVAIARALVKNPKLLILDEPTSTLSAAEAEKLFEAVRDLKRRGIAVLYVSHRMSEIERLCDRAVVLRNGRVVTQHAAPLDTQAIASAILGELVLAAQHESRDGQDVVMRGEGLRVSADRPPIDVIFRKGEVVGLTGLIGAGKTELLEQIAGHRALVGGRMTLVGRDYAPRDAAHAMEEGVVMVPEERARQSIFPGETLRHHCSIGTTGLFSRLGFMDLRRELDFAEGVIRDYRVVAPGAEAVIEALSGGNQQKLLVGRWLAHDWSLLVLDEPFRGIDIGARGMIAKALRAFSERGAVLVCSSDPEEVIEVADRVLIMVEGAILHEGRADELDAEQLSVIMSRTAAAAPTASSGTSPT